MITTRAPEPASSRATASPAKLAPQIRTSDPPDNGVRSAPRFVFLTGTEPRLGQSQGDNARDDDHRARGPQPPNPLAQEQGAGRHSQHHAGLAQSLNARHER